MFLRSDPVHSTRRCGEHDARGARRRLSPGPGTIRSKLEGLRARPRLREDHNRGAWKIAEAAVRDFRASLLACRKRGRASDTRRPLRLAFCTEAESRRRVGGARSFRSRKRSHAGVYAARPNPSRRGPRTRKESTRPRGPLPSSRTRSGTSASRATRASSRASEAPRQKCLPNPKPTCP